MYVGKHDIFGQPIPSTDPIKDAETEFRALDIADQLDRIVGNVEEAAWHLSTALDSFERLLRSGNRLPTVELRIRERLVSALLMAHGETSPSDLDTTDELLREAFDAAIVGAYFLAEPVETRSVWHPDVLRDAQAGITILRNLAHNRALAKEVVERKDRRLGANVDLIIAAARGAA